MNGRYRIASLIMLAGAICAAQDTARAPLRSLPDPVTHLRNQNEVQRNKTRDYARRHGVPAKVQLPNGGVSALSRIDTNGLPIYIQTLNANAAITTATDVVRIAPYNLDGSGFIVGVWDAGAARTTHQEFGTRVTNQDGADVHAHSTYVAGTLAAAGISTAARGMAPAATVYSYDWDDDDAEMMAAGASASGETAKIYVSNHSYGDIAGWETGDYSGNTGRHFFGEWDATPPTESTLFGQYTDRAALWDDICEARPYLLVVRAISNDRDDAAPGNGQPFYRMSWNGTEYVWSADTYNSALHPKGDGAFNSGFDTTPTFAGAKNILTVGAINDAVASGVRSLAAGTMSGFSGWGPTDDGRIKPDVVGNGVLVYSTLAASDTSYPAGSGSSGTSFSAPNVAGSAVLLQQYCSQLFSTMMRSSTLKALIIHTADDLTAGAARSGPDYSTGWGVMNTQRAADLLKLQADFPSDNYVREETLANGATTHFVYTSDTSLPLRVTICWTDPAGEPQVGLDNRTANLVNDLDLRVTAPDLGMHFPYILDVDNPSVAATTGDNPLDNVEQVYIVSPLAGPYTISISHKGTLSGGQQPYSLIISGVTGSGNAGMHDWRIIGE